MDNSSKVSIIVPCYKQAEFLPETLDSILNQTYSNWDCVIVNDGSPDHTEEVAKLYLEKDARLKYIKQENSGVCVARNTGIASTYGEFILPLDADDIIAPTYLEKAVDHFQKHPQTKLVYGKAEKFGVEKGYWDLPAYDYDKFIWSNCIFNSAMFRRCDFNATGGYNVNMVHGNEDWDFWLSLLKREDVVYRIDEIVYYYRIQNVSRTTKLLDHHLRDNLIQLCNNHPEIYDSYKGELLLYHKESEEIEALNTELLRIRHTHAYRLGKFILKPFSWIRKVVHK